MKLAQASPLTAPPDPEVELWQWALLAGLAILVVLLILSFLRDLRRPRTHPPGNQPNRRQ